MTPFPAVSYYNQDLTSLSKRIKDDYYEVLNALCERTIGHASELKGSQTYSPEKYTSLCLQLMKEIRNHMWLRMYSVIPYINELATRNRDTQSVSEIYIDSITIAHDKIRDILRLTGDEFEKLSKENEAIVLYKIVANGLSVINGELEELFLLEKTLLIPRIIEAQQHAFSAN